jgi:hypothetical protein
MLAGTGLLQIPGSPSGAGSTVDAVHTAQRQALAPPAAPEPVIPAPPAAALPAPAPPVTGGGGVDLPDPAPAPTVVSLRAVAHQADRHRAALPLPAPVRAAAPVGAVADGSALSGSVAIPGSAPQALGPVAPASATAAPARHSANADSAAAGCGGDGSPCPAEAIRSLSTEATMVRASLARGPAPACAAVAGRTVLTGPVASACTRGVHVEMLNGLPLAILADGVSSSSLTSGCPTVHAGRTTIGDLEIDGVQVAGGPGALVPTSSPEPNTTVPLATATVVLNEQRPDRTGRGLIVNAVHIVAPPSLLSPFSLDLVIGHSHSATTPRQGCAGAPVAAAAAAPHTPGGSVGPAPPEGVLPDVSEVRRLLRGAIGL